MPVQLQISRICSQIKGKTTGQQDNGNLFREVLFVFLYVLFLFVSPFVRQFEHDAKVLSLYMQSPVQALCPGKKPTEGATQPVL